MKNTAIFSGVALAVLTLAMAPASAQTINLPSETGGGSVSLGGGDSGGGSSSGGTSTGADVNLGSNGTGGSGVLGVQPRDDGTNIIDFNGDGIFDLSNGDVLDLNGNGIVDGNEGPNVELFGIGEDGATQLVVGTEGNENDAEVNLFGAPGDASGSDAARVDILTNGLDNPVDEGDVARVNALGGDEGAGETEAVVSLFGAGENDASADGNLLAGEGATGENAAALSLFGQGDDGAGGGGGEVADTGGPGGGGTGTGGSGGGSGSGGDDSDPTQTGSVGNGSAGGNGGSGGSGGGLTPARPGPNQAATRVAAVGDAQADANCFTPDETQIDYLLGRNSYDASMTASWSSAANVSIVPVNLCPEARTRLDAAIATDPNMDTLQNAVEATALITATLEPQFQADDVLAVDKSGEDLTVYVY
jgi:hypothetical protein